MVTTPLVNREVRPAGSKIVTDGMQICLHSPGKNQNQNQNKNNAALAAKMANGNLLAGLLL